MANIFNGIGTFFHDTFAGLASALRIISDVLYKFFAIFIKNIITLVVCVIAIGISIWNACKGLLNAAVGAIEELRASTAFHGGAQSFGLADHLAFCNYVFPLDETCWALMALFSLFVVCLFLALIRYVRRMIAG